MADQIERVVLEADESAAVEGVKKGNAALDSFERKTEAMGRTVLRVADTSRGALQRMVASVERRASAATSSPLERLAADRSRDLSRAGGDEQAVNRIKDAYERLAVAQRAADNASLLEKAITGSKRAASATLEFERALAQTNRTAEQARLKAAEAAKQREQEINREIAALEKRARFAGKSGVDRLRLEEGDALSKLGNTAENAERIRAAFSQLRAEQQTAPPGLVKTVIEAGILLSVGERLVGTFKAFTVDATLYAARTEQLGVALNAVARANGVSSGTVAVLEQNLKKLGVTTQDARANLARLIAANVDYRKATDLARAAQDLGRVSGEGTAAAFERITHAIVTGQPELLRYLGLNVNLEKAYQRVAKSQGRTAESLSEQEKIQIRTNETLQAAQAYTGVYATSLDTVGGRLLSLKRKSDEARNAIGERFQGEAGVTLSILEKIAEKAGQFPSVFIGAGFAVTTLVGAFAALTGGTIVAGLGVLSIALGAVGITALAVKKKVDDVSQAIDFFTNRDFKAQAKEILGSVSIDKFNEASRRQREEAERFGQAQAASTKAQAEAKKRAKELAERIAHAEKRAHEELLSAQKKELGTMGAIILQYQDYRREIGLSAKARRDLAQAVQVRLHDAAGDDQRKAAKSRIEAIERDRNEADKKAIAQATAFQGETLQIQQDTDRARFDASEKVAERIRDAELRSLEGLQAETINQKLAIEQRKLQIESEFINRSSVLAAEKLQREQELELTALEVRYNAKLISEEQFQTRRAAIIDAYGEKGRQLDLEFQDRSQAAQQNAANRSAQLVFDHNKRIYERIKHSAEGIFDQLFTKSQNIFQAIGNVFKTAMLTALKEVVTSQIALAFTRLLAGVRSTGSQGSGLSGITSPAGGGFGRILGLGGLFGSGSFGGVPFPGSAPNFPGAPPGGTPPFIPAGTSRGGFGGFGNFAGFGASGKGFLSQLGNIGFGPKGGDFGGEVAGSFRGVGGAKGGGLLLGGGILAADGLRRGGLTGLAETTAGGALIGFKFGGPIGALIGGAIGAAAGLVRLFIKGAEQKAIDKVKQLYQITIDRGFAKTIVGIAKQQYGGDLDLAIRTREVKDLLELYAMSRGQSPAGLGISRPQSLSLVQGGAGLFQSQSFSNGTALPALSGLPSLGVSQPAASPTTVVIQLDGKATTDVLQGQAVDVIQNQPGVVQGAVNAASKLSIGRRESATRLVPGFAAG